MEFVLKTSNCFKIGLSIGNLRQNSPRKPVLVIMNNHNSSKTVLLFIKPNVVTLQKINKYSNCNIDSIIKRYTNKHQAKLRAQSSKIPKLLRSHQRFFLARPINMSACPRICAPTQHAAGGNEVVCGACRK